MSVIRLRKHIPTDHYVTWVTQTPGGLFHDLSTAEAKAVQEGAEAFAKAFPGVQLFPDPFLAPRSLAAAPRLEDLIIVPGEEPWLMRVAEALAAEIKQATGRAVVVKPAAELTGGLATDAPLVFIGCSHQNEFSREIFRRFQLGIFDCQFPGRGGWGITCHGELEPGMEFRYIMACDESNAAAAIRAYVDEAIDSVNTGHLRWMHTVSPSPQLQEHVPDFVTWLKTRIQHLQNFDPIVAWGMGGFVRPYSEVYVDVMTADYSDGVIANGGLIDIGIEALRYYQQMGDLRGLDLFREMVRGLSDYLNHSAAAIYPSDLDFRMGAFCDAWNWLEWHPSVSKEELELVPKVLLGAMRIVHGYFVHLWKYRNLTRKMSSGRREELDYRHNHETFPALGLLQAWRYFRRWSLAELPIWLEDCDYIFTAIRPEWFKYSENANFYEGLVPLHFLTWLEVSGREIPPVFRDSLAKIARRQWLMRDNGYRLVDYGDSGLEELRPSRPLVVSPWLVRGNPSHSDVIEYEEVAGGHFAPHIPAATHAYTGVAMSAEKSTPPSYGKWEVMPVDPLFGHEFSFSGSSSAWFDKLCLRQSWQPEAFYLAVEGIGAANGISHGHHEVSGILRANFGGRIWLVSNGYGRPIGEQRAGKAFMQRQRGPVDHNMLLLRMAGEETPVLPPVNALLCGHTMDPVPYATTQVTDYGGCIWRRHIVALREHGLVVVDRLRPVTEANLPSQVWLEWNILGAVRPDASGATVEQAGINARFQHFGSVSCEWSQNLSTDWQTVLSSGSYPYASSPLQKAIVRAHLPQQWSADGLTLVTGLWLQGAMTTVEWLPSNNQLILFFADEAEPLTLTLP